MEHFIETVRKYPCLWKTTAIEYRDQELKDAAWAEVMKNTDSASVKDVKLKWKKLRDSYREALRRYSEMMAKEPQPQGKRSYPWKYMGQMQFLQPHMNARKKQAESPSYTPSTASLDVSLDGMPDTPHDVGLDAPLDAQIDAPLDAPLDAPINAPLNAPINAPLNAQLHVSLNAPLNEPLNTPLNATLNVPLNPQLNAPLHVQVNAPINALFDTPINTQLNSPLNAPLNAPLNTPFNAPLEASLDAPFDAPPDAPLGTTLNMPHATQNGDAQSSSSSSSSGSSPQRRSCDRLAAIDRKLEYLCRASAATAAAAAHEASGKRPCLDAYYERKRSPPQATSSTDPLDIFFNSMCQTTKRFPYQTQVKIKKLLFNAVMEAEEVLIAEQQSYAELWARGADSSSSSETGVAAAGAASGATSGTVGGAVSSTASGAASGAACGTTAPS